MVILRVGILNLNPAIIDSHGFQSRKQVLNGWNSIAIFRERGTQRRFRGVIDRSGNHFRSEIEVPPFSGQLRPQFHRRNLPRVYGLPLPLYITRQSLLNPPSLHSNKKTLTFRLVLQKINSKIKANTLNYTFYLLIHTYIEEKKKKNPFLLWIPRKPNNIYMNRKKVRERLQISRRCIWRTWKRLRHWKDSSL